MVMYGADVEQLRAAAAQLSGGAGALENSARALHSLIGNGTYWRGPDADRFRAQWSNSSMPVVTMAVESLRDAADQLRRNADEQDIASAAGTTTATGGTAAATNTSELLKHVRNDHKDVDRMRIERVVGPDGKTRLIVYFKGQESVAERSFWRSAGLASGSIQVDKDLVREIDEILTSTPDGKRTEVMLVGLSQGGMDAQNIAASGRYNVTALVTYGSPIVQSDVHGVATVHMQADGDHVPGMGFGRGAGTAIENMASGQYVPGIGLGAFFVDLVSPPSSQSVFKCDPGLAANVDVHANGYPKVANAFDASQDPRFDEVKQRMKDFQGRVIDSVE